MQAFRAASVILVLGFLGTPSNGVPHAFVRHEPSIREEGRSQSAALTENPLGPEVKFALRRGGTTQDTFLAVPVQRSLSGHRSMVAVLQEETELPGTVAINVNSPVAEVSAVETSSRAIRKVFQSVTRGPRSRDASPSSALDWIDIPATPENSERIASRFLSLPVTRFDAGTRTEAKGRIATLCRVARTGATEVQKLNPSVYAASRGFLPEASRQEVTRRGEGTGEGQQPESITVQVGRVMGIGGAAVIFEAETGEAGTAHGPHRSLAMKVFYSSHASGIAEAKWKAGLLGQASKEVRAAELFPKGVSTQDLVEKYGMALPLWEGILRSKEAVTIQAAANGQEIAFSNSVVFLPKMHTDLGSLAYHRFDREMAAYTIKRMVQLLAYLHAAGLVHRDIKLDNMLVSPSADLYMGDFGSVVTDDRAPRPCAETYSAVYLDPEAAACVLEASGKAVLQVATQARDAFALGISAYLLWCKGELPFGLKAADKEGPQRLLATISELPKLKNYTKELHIQQCRPKASDKESREIQAVITGFLHPDSSKRRLPLEVYCTSSLFGGTRCEGGATAAVPRTPA